MKKTIILLLIFLYSNANAIELIDSTYILKTTKNIYRVESISVENKKTKEIYFGYTIINLGNQINPDSLYNLLMPERFKLGQFNPRYLPTVGVINRDSLRNSILSPNKISDYLKNGVEMFNLKCTYDLSGKILEVQEIFFSSKKPLNIEIEDFEKIEEMEKKYMELEPKEKSDHHPEAIKNYQKIKYFTIDYGILLIPIKRPKNQPLPPGYKAIPKFDKPLIRE
jgi:hypothetical protein